MFTLALLNAHEQYSSGSIPLAPPPPPLPSSSHHTMAPLSSIPLPPQIYHFIQDNAAIEEVSLNYKDTIDVCIACYADIRSDVRTLICCNATLCPTCDFNRRFTVGAPCPNPQCSLDGDTTLTPCIVCFNEVSEARHKRTCCSQVVCRDCVRQIVHFNIEDEGRIYITCPNPECKNGVIGADEVMMVTSGSTKEKYERMKAEDTGGKKKTCPNCCLITEHDLPGKFKRYQAKNVKITCTKCHFDWCFHCNAPWHTDTTCKQFQRGDKHFKKWTKLKSRTGVANCQKCPLCQVYIQRSTGCDHMTCSRCETEFCYKCGGLLSGIPGLGDHYKQTSIFGCKYNYKPNQPFQRKAVRGGYLGAKVAMLTGYPVLFIAGLAVVLVIGVVALPVYGGYRYYKYRKNMKRIYKRPRH